MQCHIVYKEWGRDTGPFLSVSKPHFSLLRHPTSQTPVLHDVSLSFHYYFDMGIIYFSLT